MDKLYNEYKIDIDIIGKELIELYNQIIKIDTNIKNEDEFR